jgi:hypothetical protein
MKVTRLIILTLGLAIAFSGAMPLLKRIFADTKPMVQLNIASTAPRAVEDSTQQAIVRDYSAAWQGMSNALANNSTGPLNDNFTGYALDKLTERVKEQTQNGIKTRIVDHGHKVDAIFYSPDGSAIELKDTATLETQVLDGDTVIHSDQSQVRYYAVMTGAEDRWKVRVLESAQ